MPESKETPAAPSLVDRYEYGEPRAEVPAAPAPETPAPEKVRDEKGRFVKPAEAPKVSPVLAKAALALGLTEEDIAGSDPGEIRDAITALQMNRLHEQRQPVRDLVETTPSQAREPQLSPDLDEGLTAVIRSLQAEVASLKKSLVEEIGKVRGERQAETVANRADRAFRKHAKILGEGDRDDIDRNSPEFARRRAVLGMVAGMTGSGSFESKVDKAVTTLFGGSGGVGAKAPTSSEETASAERGGYTPEQWLDAGLSAPTHQVSSERPQGRERAIEAVEQHQRENGTLIRQRPAAADDFPSRRR